MITEFIIKVFFEISGYVIGILFEIVTGIIPFPDEWRQHFIELLEYGLYFIPKDIFVVVISYFIGWYIVNLTWGIIEFIIRKIPGIS